MSIKIVGEYGENGEHIAGFGTFCEVDPTGEISVWRRAVIDDEMPVVGWIVQPVDGMVEIEPVDGTAGVRTLHRRVTLIPQGDPRAIVTARALDALLDVAVEEWSGHMTCSEAEALAGLYAAFNRNDVAQALIDRHALTDEEGDEHWKGNE